MVNPHLWQPGEGYLYELASQPKARQSVISTRCASASGSSSEGRTVPDQPQTVLLYWLGRHEDADLRGKGFDNVLMVTITH